MSLRADGDRVSAGSEELTFSNLWDGDAEATVTIAQDGAAIFTGLSGEGVKTWTVDRNGRYELTHTTYTNGVAGKVETAVFVVEGKEVPVSELTIDWGQSSFVYDGQPKEPVIGVKHGEQSLTKDTDYEVSYLDNINVGTAKAIVKGLDLYVGEVTNEFAITAAPIGPGGDEPGPGPIPVGGLSKFDATYVYDGEGHTINTQALYAVTLVGSTPSFSFSLDGETGWQNDPFVYTNVGEYVMWYKITAPNYADYKHQAKVTILAKAYEDCCLTFTSTNEFSFFDISEWNHDGKLFYSFDNVYWTEWTGGPIVAQKDSSKNQYVLNLRGSGNTYVNCKDDHAHEEYSPAVKGTDISCRGNVETLLDYEIVAIGGHPIMFDFKDYKPHSNSFTGAFEGLFAGCEGLLEAPELAATNLVSRCYKGMFAGCFSLRRAPKLPATTLAASCYSFMFQNCSALEIAPELPATNLMEDCYSYMFARCVSLRQAPALPAAELAESCYYAMFRYCSSLTKTPALPALKTYVECYMHMFDTCTNLQEITDLPATNLADRCYSYMFDRCEKLRIYECGVGATWQIPDNAKVEVEDCQWREGWNFAMFRGTDTDFVADPVPGKMLYFKRALHTSSGLVDSETGSSVYSIETVYDGTSHTINTNDLPTSTYEINKVIWSYTWLDSNVLWGAWHEPAREIVTNQVSDLIFDYSLTSNGVYQTEPFAFKDVVSTSYWYRISSPGFADYIHEAQVVITNRPVTLTSATDSKTYDGVPLVNQTVEVGGLGWAMGEGATYQVTGSQTIAGSTGNAFTYALSDGAKADNYDISTIEGTLTVYKGSVGPGGGEEPGPGVIPEGGLSKFDATYVYDGEGHTINTQDLYAVTLVGSTPSFNFSLDGETGWQEEPFVYTNVCSTSFWYKVSAPNYEDFVHEVRLAVTNRPVTVTVVGHSVSPFYDTTEKTVSGYDITTEDALYDVATMTAFSGTASAARTDVGTTAMGLKADQFANTDPNFAVTYVVTDGGVTIVSRVIGDDPANWDIRLDKAPMYDGEVQSAPIIQVCYVKPDGNLDYIPYTLAGNTATDAGNYKVRISGTGNYTGTVEKDWAIMPRNLKLTSGTAEWMYDGETHSNDTVTVTGDGFVEGEGATYAGFPQVTHFADAAEPVENAFAYKLNGNTKAKNYEIVTEKGKVAISRRPIALTAPTKSKTYDGEALTFAAGEVAIGGEGYAEGEAFTLFGFASITEAGQTAATFTIADGTALTADYDITVTPGATLTVQKSATEITVTAKSQSWTYDGASHELNEYDATNLGTLVGGDQLEVTFSADSVVTTPSDGEVENKIVSVKVVRITGGQQQDVTANYTLAAYSGTLKVTKRPVTLTSKSASKTYDGTPLVRHEVEVGGDGFVGNDGATYVFSGSQLDKGKSKNAFEYSLKSGTDAGCYEITKVEGELEVFPADISAGTELDWEIVLGPALTYSGIAQIQTVTSAKYKGLDLDYTVSGNQQTDAGDYELTLTGQGNFTGTKTVAWTLNPKPLTLTAGSGSKPYDGTPLTVGTVTPDGFVAGEAATYACTGSQLDVGTSENVVTTINWTEAKASNYAVTKKPGTLAVTPRAVTVTSKNISKPFDGTPLKLTAGDITVQPSLPGVESFVYGDFAERIEAGQTAATFSIAAGVNTKLTNYAITPVYGTITITKSATEIGVTARSKSWPYDATTHALHEYDATNLNILQPGEELVVTFKETSVVTTPKDGPGEDGKVANEIESIRVVKNGSQDVTANYTVTAYSGVLTVTKRPVTVTVEGKTVSATYDGEEHAASGYDIATEDELYDLEAKTAFDGADEVTRTDAGKSEMGLESSDFTNSDEFFDVTYAVTDGWVSVVPADISAGEEDFVLTLGANPKYNGTVQTIPVTAVTYKGLPVTYTLAGENATHAGTYTLTVKANGNFKGERSTTWKILKRQVKLTSGSASRAYNGQPLVNGDVTVSGDGFIGVEGATYSVTGSQALAGSSKNTFAYTLKAGTLEGDYDIQKVEGDLVVACATLDLTEVVGPMPVSMSLTYDGMEHPFVVTPTFAETYRMLYAAVPNDEGAYSETPIKFKNATASNEYVYFKMITENYKPLYGTGTVHIAKCPVSPPNIPSKTYTGAKLTADVPESSLYTTSLNAGGRGAGTYAVMLKLVDASNYVWTTTDKASVRLSFVVRQAVNEWTETPAISGWTQGETPVEPTATAKFGKPDVLYWGTADDGTVYENSLAVYKPGGYNAVFRVRETPDYSGLYADVPFRIEASGGGDGLPPVTIAAKGWYGARDGGRHGVSVRVSGGDGTLVVSYASEPNGPWTGSSPTFSDVGTHEVWYRVTSPNYETFEGVLKVVIY